MRRNGCLVACTALTLGCHGGTLAKIVDSLEFDSPDAPAAVSQPDVGHVDVDFGSVGLQSTKSLILQLTSTNGPIVLGAVTALQADDEFTLPFVPGTSVGFEPAQIVVTFAPTSLGPKTAVYTLATDSSSDPLVRLMLTGQGVPQALTVAPDPIDFGNVELHETATLAVTITNNGATPAVLALSALSGSTPIPFSLDPVSSTALAVGSSVGFDAHFAPLLAGTASASFTLSGCDSCGQLIVPLAGAGVASVLQVTPDPLHFGFIQPGGGAVESLTIANIGNQAVDLLAPGPTLASGAAPAGFSFGSPLATTPGSYPFVLAAGQRALLPISFVPPRLGFFASSLSLRSGDPGARNVLVPIDGFGGGARIACVPSPLGFGPVAIGEQLTESIVCTNTGTDVPGHPEAALFISQAGLAIATPLFTVGFGFGAGAIGSPSGTEAGATLAAGQSAEIDVTYGPTAAEADTATLTVASNDTATPALSIPLSGQGIVPGACTIAVTPAQLSFAEVPKGSSAEQQLEISNSSSRYCAVTDIALDPASDPAFSLPAGVVPYALLGFAGNPLGAATSLRVPVRFAPLVSESVATGKLTFSAAGLPEPPVPLAGSSAPACLVVLPASYDFGRVGFNSASGRSCVTETATFTAQNVCSVPVTLDAISIDSGLDATPQFELVQNLTLPLTIVPAGQLSFGAIFDPTATGPKAGAVRLDSSEFATPYQISLLGDAEAAGRRTDTFTAQQNKVDLVFILDDDDDLTEIEIVAQELPGFIQAANDAQLDYRIALTSTDICSAQPSDQGSFEPCDHCTASASPSPIYLTPQTPNAAQILSDLFVIHEGTACVPSVVGDEHFFGSIEAIFQPALLAAHNSGFLRDDAYLALVVVNGDGEDDRSNITPQAIVSLVQGLKADPDRVSVSYIDQGIVALSMAPLMSAVIQATGGVVLDTSTQWVPGFFDLFWATERLGGFVLGTTPDPLTLLVEENGVPFAPQSNGTTIWSYNPATNAVIFSPGSVPVPGTVITIAYAIACD